MPTIKFTDTTGLVPEIFYPKPSKYFLPQWVKNIPPYIDQKQTGKRCVPMIDAMISGYTIVLTEDIRVSHKDEQPYYEWTTGGGIEFHQPEQVRGNPIASTHSMPKWISPWGIETPKGYSCLFLPLINNQDDRFFPIAGIVDTDTYRIEINFPIVINGYKYPELDTVIKKGTPYVQVIPFKREGWKAKFSKKTTKEIIKNHNNYSLKLLHNYKTRFWNKKSWK